MAILRERVNIFFELVQEVVIPCTFNGCVPSQSKHLLHYLLVIPLVKVLISLFFLELVAFGVGVDPTPDFPLQSHEATLLLDDN